MKQKYWAIVILVSLAVVVICIYYVRQPAGDVGPVVIYHQPKVVKNLIATSTHFVANPVLSDKQIIWKTYSNQKYGFEFQYPSQAELVINDSLENSTEHFSLKLNYGNNFVTDIYIYNDMPDSEGREILSKNLPYTFPSTEISGPMKLIERNMMNATGRELYGDNMEGHGYYDYFYFQRKGMIWQFGLDPILEKRIDSNFYGDESIYGKNQEAYKRFWTSFKLINPTVPDYISLGKEWKLYYDEQNNFQVQYPISYKEQNLVWTISGKRSGLENYDNLFSRDSSGQKSKALFVSRLANKQKYSIGSKCLPQDKEDSQYSEYCTVISLDPYVILTYWDNGSSLTRSTALDFISEDYKVNLSTNIELGFKMDKDLLTKIVSSFKFSK